MSGVDQHTCCVARRLYPLQPYAGGQQGCVSVSCSICWCCMSASRCLVFSRRLLAAAQYQLTVIRVLYPVSTDDKIGSKVACARQCDTVEMMTRGFCTVPLWSCDCLVLQLRGVGGVAASGLRVLWRWRIMQWLSGSSRSVKRKEGGSYG